jgi:hypothetical protein
MSWVTYTAQPESNRVVTITVEECSDRAGMYYLLITDETVQRAESCDELHDLIEEFVNDNWC